MSVRVGTRKISSIQKDYLQEALTESDPIERARGLVEVFTDQDIQSGREELHSQWAKIFQSEKTHLQQMLPKIQFEKLKTTLRIQKPYDEEISELNPKKSRIAFLLGAGASKPKPSDIPTVKELLPDLLGRARRLDRSDLKGLADFCEQSKIENIEDLLTAAQLSEYCSQNTFVLKLVEYLLYRKETESDRKRFDRTRRESVDLSAVAFLKDTLQVLFGLLSSRMLPAPPNDGHKAIASYVHANKDSAIITTNYDCCIDLALGDEGKDFTYLVDFANSTKSSTLKNLSPLIKLHGSLNWFYCDTCQHVHLVDIKRTVQDYKKDVNPYPVIAICRGCGGQRRGLLVPPLALKFDVAPPLTPLIEKAQLAFNKSEIIIVVGYSFAEADLYISRMLVKSLQQMSKNVKMVIFDPDPSVVEKVRRQFDLRIPNFDQKRILRVEGDCAKMLPQFLRGNLIKKQKRIKQLLQSPDQSRIQRIPMNVPATMHEILFFVNMHRLERSLEQRSGPRVSLIECLRITVEDRLNNLGKRNFAVLPQKNMIMVWHEAVSDHCCRKFVEVPLQ